MDDCDFNCLTFSAALKAQYHFSSVDKALNGEIALKLYTETLNEPRYCCGKVCPYKVVFTDMNMPVMDGEELTKKIRQLEEE